jgi:hypothetical protein
MTKELEELLAANQQINAERARLRAEQRKLWEQIDPLLEEAEAERRANPTPGAAAQTVG